MSVSRVALILLLASSFVLAQSREEKTRDKHYEKWLDQDVDYIISDDERAVFKKLQTTEEKDAFIEEFWRRRSSNPTTAPDEFKEEHYRRIAYVNAKFGSAARKSGFEEGFDIVEIKVPSGRHSPFWFYLPGLLMIGLVWWAQGRRLAAARP